MKQAHESLQAALGQPEHSGHATQVAHVPDHTLHALPDFHTLPD